MLLLLAFNVLLGEVRVLVGGRQTVSFDIYSNNCTIAKMYEYIHYILKLYTYINDDTK